MENNKKHLNSRCFYLKFHKYLDKECELACKGEHDEVARFE